MVEKFKPLSYLEPRKRERYETIDMTAGTQRVIQYHVQ